MHTEAPWPRRMRLLSMHRAGEYMSAEQGRRVFDLGVLLGSLLLFFAVRLVFSAKKHDFQARDLMKG